MKGKTGAPRESCCRCCKAPCSVCVHRDCCRNAATLHICFMDKEYDIEPKRNKSEPIIQCKASDTEIKISEYPNTWLSETGYNQHKTIFNKLHSFLDEIKNIVDYTQILSVCTVCNRPNYLGRCKRCEYNIIGNKLQTNKDEKQRQQQEYVDSLIVKINDILRGILECDNIDQHAQYDDTISLDELDGLFRELNRELRPSGKQRLPRISIFPRFESSQFVSAPDTVVDRRPTRHEKEEVSTKGSTRSLHKKKLVPSTEEFTINSLHKKLEPKTKEFPRSLQKKKLVPMTEDSTSSLHKKLAPTTKESTRSLYKKLVPTTKESTRSIHKKKLVSTEELILDILSKVKADGGIKPHPSADSQFIPRSTSCIICKNLKQKKPLIDLPVIKPIIREPEKVVSLKLTKPMVKLSKSNLNIKRKEEKKEVNKFQEVKKEAKEVKASSFKLQKKEEKKEAREVKASSFKFLHIETCVQNENNQKENEEKLSAHDKEIILSTETLTEEFGSYVECETVKHERKEMIKGTSIVRSHPLYNESPRSPVAPLLFDHKIAFESADDINKEKGSASEVLIKTRPSILPTLTKSVPNATKKPNKYEEIGNNAFLKYSLSNREFIDKGWTVLPTTKVMRRMNIYKMEPPPFNWFERNKNQEIIFYDSGEKLAEIDDEGTGRWYYKNGMIALDYYNAEELNASQRYVVYSSGEETINGRKAPISVMAAFDFLGNGVVYDSYGKERLKYNQSEGVILDGKIGPPSRWYWHTLNEPANLQPVFVDTRVNNPDPEIELLIHQAQDRFVKEPNEDMLAIEFDNFVKEKAHKLLRKFKPFEIRMKALKINDQFSLRVQDQSSIYLLFRDCKTFMKLNVGMVLKSDEIVDTEACEVNHVNTPYDRTPPKTQSLADIQHTIKRARRIGKIRENRQPLTKCT